MRVNIYAEEMTDRIEIIGKAIEGHTYTGLRIYLELPVTVGGQQYQGPFMHRPGDDDSSAVTFWGKRDLREVLNKASAMLDAHYAEYDRAQLQASDDPQQTEVLTGINLSRAMIDVLTERKRQVTDEGWTPEHDDETHQHGDLAAAGAAYSLAAASALNPNTDTLEGPPDFWPWWNSIGRGEGYVDFGAAWWKPKDPRRNLVRAGALIIAEIERLDRVAAKTPTSEPQA